MKFKFESWPVKKLLKLYSSQKLNLNPPYQRNPIWPVKKQKDLISSLKSNSALPAFFVLEKAGGSYEMVDGQQRSRTLIAYDTTTDLNEKKGVVESFKTGAFLNYPLNVTVITGLEEGEKIEDFYTRINSSGLHLNRPETFKAKFYEKKLLDLVEELSVQPKFVELDLFPENAKKRMLDRDLVEELVALSAYGITDKKEQVDRMYEKDIDDEPSKKVREDFDFAINVISEFNKIEKINQTRYRQRNDFYTLFGYLILNKGLKEKTYQHFYKVLLALELGIRPDKTACAPLADYAFNCISQSNSSRAREKRYEILDGILGKLGKEMTEVQAQIVAYYNLPANGTTEVERRKMLAPSILKLAVSKKELSA